MYSPQTAITENLPSPDFFSPNVWLPHYIFILYTVAVYYPLHPNEVTRRKYYDFIQNLPIFIPHDGFSNQFASYLDQYPVSPYLVSRISFMKWVSFIHNKINYSQGKPEMTYLENWNSYMEQYGSPIPYHTDILRRYFSFGLFQRGDGSTENFTPTREYISHNRRIIFLAFIVLLIIFIYVYLSSTK